MQHTLAKEDHANHVSVSLKLIKLEARAFTVLCKLSVARLIFFMRLELKMKSLNNCYYFSKNGTDTIKITHDYYLTTQHHISTV